MAFTVLALRLEVRGFWHGRVAFNHNAPSAVKRAGIVDDIGPDVNVCQSKAILARSTQAGEGPASPIRLPRNCQKLPTFRASLCDLMPKRHVNSAIVAFSAFS
jgi:hypothetical protein